MAGLAFRDRFFTPKVWRAIASPWSILLAVGVAAAAALVGVPLVAAVPLGLAAYGLRVLVAVPRERAERIDPFTVGEPWRRFVQEALQARGRFDEVVHRMQPGPLRDNLATIARRIHAATEESYRIAQRGQVLSKARRSIDVGRIERQRDDVAGGDPADPVVSQVTASLDAQRASADRLDRVVAEAQAQLRLLDARLDEALARAVELSAQASQGGQPALPGAEATVGSLSTDVDQLVTDMEALRQALEETHGTPGGLASPGGPP